MPDWWQRRGARPDHPYARARTPTPSSTGRLAAHASWRRWAWARAAGWPPTLARGSEFAALLHAAAAARRRARARSTRGCPPPSSGARRELAGADARGRRAARRASRRRSSRAASWTRTRVHTRAVHLGHDGRAQARGADGRQPGRRRRGVGRCPWVEPGDRWLCPLPLFHIAGLAILVRCARVGHDGRAARAASTWSRVGARWKAARRRWSRSWPTQLAATARRGPERCARPARDAARRRAGPAGPARVGGPATGLPARCTYGMTESASQVVVTEVGETAGRPLPGAEIEIGAGRARSWFAARWSRRRRWRRTGWLHTGDIGRIDRARPAARGGADQGADRHGRRERGAGGGRGGAARPPRRRRRRGGRAAGCGVGRGGDRLRGGAPAGGRLRAAGLLPRAPGRLPGAKAGVRVDGAAAQRGRQAAGAPTAGLR